MIKKVFILFCLFAWPMVHRCHAQAWSISLNVGGVAPIERTFAGVALRHRIAPRYSLGIVSELSQKESNLAPTLSVDLWHGLSADVSFGWGHVWRKEGCSDHNFHTYGLALRWTKSLSGHWSISAGPSMLWRSYQSHIGFHRGTLRLCAGFNYTL